MVSAFFLFSIGCLNMFLVCHPVISPIVISLYHSQGLIFREKARYKRSLTSWKDDQSVLPKVSPDMRPVFTSPPPAFVSKFFKDTSTTPDQDAKRTAELEEEARTLGFGRQLESKGDGFGLKGEKAAGLKGNFIFGTW